MAALALALACTRASPPPPNVVVILIDDLGWADLGAFGNPRHATPSADRLAREGARFTHAYANAPNCAPARASIISGQYGPRHGIYSVRTNVRPPPGSRRLEPVPSAWALPPATVTIAEALRPHGYRTASIGKWHLGFGPRFAPTTQGFDVDVGSSAGAGHTHSHFSPYRMRGLADGPPGEALTERLTDEAVRFITTGPEPFFLYLSHYAVHEPWQASYLLDPARDRALRGAARARAVYAAMVEATDRGVGRLLDTLDGAGLAERTVVILMSDNGGHALGAGSDAAHGAKGTLYEGGLRVPLIVRWPGVVVAGRMYDEPVMGIDLYPTILAATGTPPPAGHVLDGVDLLPLLAGTGTLPPRPLFWHFPDYLWSRHLGRFRLTPASAVRLGDHKLVEFLEDGRTELYDLARDPDEREDRSARDPARVGELRTVLDRWRTSVGAPRPQPVSAGAPRL